MKDKCPACLWAEPTACCNYVNNELLLNNSVLLLLWEKCIDEFRSGSNAAGVAKSLLICGMKELFLFEKLF